MSRDIEDLTEQIVTLKELEECAGKHDLVKIILEDCGKILKQQKQQMEAEMIGMCFCDYLESGECDFCQHQRTREW